MIFCRFLNMIKGKVKSVVCLRASIRTFVNSTTLLANRYAKNKKIQIKSEPSGLTVSTYLNDILKKEKTIDWTKLKTQIVGLPVNAKLLVNKNNVDNVLWQEALNHGSVKNGIELYNVTQDNFIVRDSNFLKLLVDAPVTEILPNEDFVLSFIKNMINNSGTSERAYWNCVSVLSKTSKWKEEAEKIAEFELDDNEISEIEDASKITGYNEFGNFAIKTKVLANLAKFYEHAGNYLCF